MEKKDSARNGDEEEEHKEPPKSTAPGGGPPRTIHPWNDDDDTNYFMSEPSVSEAESSEYVRPTHFASLLAPRAESPSNSDASSKDLLHPRSTPPPPTRPHPSSNPNSPGTSISSWDSPHLFRKQVQLYFSPDKGSKHLQVPSTPNLNNNNNNNNRRRTSNRSTSSSSSTNNRQKSDDFLRNLKRQSVGALKDARPEDFDSDRSQVVNGADREQVNAVFANVSTKKTPIVQTVDTDQDETIVMDLSTDEEEEEEATKTTEEPLDWEAKHSSADDEKTAERAPRKITKRAPGGHRRTRSGDGHRRTRSGDAAAASLMTGGKDWKGMQIHQLPIPSEHDDEEDEHDHTSHTSDEVQKNVTSSFELNSTLPSSNRMNINGDGGGFAVGSGKNARAPSKRPRRNQRVRRPIPRAMDRHETDSTLEEEQQQRLSRDAFSRFALESPRAVPKYVGRASPTNESLSTIDQYTSDRVESDSSGHGAGPARRRTASEMDFRILNRSRRTNSEADVMQPTLEHRVSDISFDSSRGHGPSRGHGSSLSWIPGSYHRYYEPRLSASHDPQYDYRYHQYPFDEAPTTFHGRVPYQFGDAEDATPDDTESDYSFSDDAMEDERNIHSNRVQYGPEMRLDELERLLEDKEMRGRSQHVLRHASPMQKFGKMASPKTRRASYMPKSESAGDYPTFVCPVCKTRQREFFTASSAPSQFQGPGGYLALYFAIYVIAALFIFGLEEGWQALDCVYFAVITLTTAGLGDFVPTSDGAKILCSIFIYFGVACIGLLLGSYLASMLDDKSYKQAQKNRVENCPNCARLRNLKTVQMRRQKEKARHLRKQHGSMQAQAVMGFMSERTSSDRSGLGPHVLEREQTKRARTQSSPPKSPGPASAVSESSESSTRKMANFVDAPVDEQRGNGESALKEETDKTTSSDGNQDKGEKQGGDQPELEVIDSFNVSSPEPTTNRKTSTSPGSMGSPFTSQILGRQSHTRHISLGGHDLNYSSTADRRFARPRKYSEDLGRSQISESIPEETPLEAQSPKSWTQQNHSIEESESDDESSDESIESDDEISTESDVTLDETARRIKTAKYVLLTLKQALMNSVLIILIGGLGFFTIEGMGAVDSFYFTTVLLTTVGYGGKL